MPQIDFNIAKRFCGPPRSGNGGYVCGSIAKHMDSLVEVRLMAPPPLETPLELKIEDNTATLSEQGNVIAKASVCEWDMEVIPAPNLAQAKAAEKHYAGLKQHSLPSCFVCGPKREPGDGMRIFAGRLEGQDVVACSWQPQDLPATNGEIDTEFVWAALDCPGFFAVQHRTEFALLGAFSVKQFHPVYLDQPHIIVGWPEQSEGRKHYAGTAIYNEGGELLAQARATWISVAKDAFVATC